MGARLWLLIPKCLTAALRGRGGGIGCHRAAAAPAALWGYERSAGRPRRAAVPPPRSASRSRTAASCWGSTRVAASRASTGSAAGQVRAVRPPDPPQSPAGRTGRCFGTPQTPPRFHPQCRLRMPLAWRAAGAGRAVRTAGTMRPARCRRIARCVRPCCAARRAACWPCSSACCSLITAGGARREQRGVLTIPSPRPPPPRRMPPLRAPGAADGPLSPQRIRASGVVLLETILFGSLLLYFPVSARPNSPPAAPSPPCRKPHRPWAAPCCHGAQLGPTGLCRGSGLAPRRTQHCRHCRHRSDSCGQNLLRKPNLLPPPHGRGTPAQTPSVCQRAKAGLGARPSPGCHLPQPFPFLPDTSGSVR